MLIIVAPSSETISEAKINFKQAEDGQITRKI